MTGPRVLNQVIATKKGIQSRVEKEVSDLHRTLQKPDLFNGHSKKYVPKDDTETETYPDDDKKVQYEVPAILKSMAFRLTERFDVEVTADTANAAAKADVVVNGATILKDVPVTTIMFLKKQVADWRASLEAAPELDSSEYWEKDPNSSLYRTRIQQTNKTKKLQKALVLYPHSDKHPAQTQMITEDVVTGNWNQQKISGALPTPDKATAIGKANQLLDALQVAQEAANSVAVTDVKIGAPLFNFLLGAGE